MRSKHTTRKYFIRFGRTIGTGIMLGVLAVTSAGCVAEYNPPRYYDSYPDDYTYYRYQSDNYSAYSGDYDSYAAERDADKRNGWGHSDDRNFHNQNDYDSYDR